MDVQTQKTKDVYAKLIKQETRIAALEAENACLKTEIARLLRFLETDIYNDVCAALDKVADGEVLDA